MWRSDGGEEEGDGEGNAEEGEEEEAQLSEEDLSEGDDDDIPMEAEDTKVEFNKELRVVTRY